MTCLIIVDGILNYGNDAKFVDPQECHQHHNLKEGNDDDDLDDVESQLIPFDEREHQILGDGEDSHFKKQQKSKLPFSFLMKNYFKSNNKVRGGEADTTQDGGKRRRQIELDTGAGVPSHQPKVKHNNFMTTSNTATSASASLKAQHHNLIMSTKLFDN